jgi:D-glycero-D-manno-heptose 1,7-bisphosphate phosphatase
MSQPLAGDNIRSPRPIISRIFHQPLPGSAALLVDRDGVINRRIVDGYVLEVGQLVVLEAILPLLRQATVAATPIVIISNQGAVGRGLVSESELDLINTDLVDRLGHQSVEIAAIYVCPHHHAALDAADRSCSCRKPAPGLIHTATQQLSLDIERCAFIGDQPTDGQAALAAGVPARAIWELAIETASTDEVEAVGNALGEWLGRLRSDRKES